MAAVLCVPTRMAMASSHLSKVTVGIGVPVSRPKTRLFLRLGLLDVRIVCALGSQNSTVQSCEWFAVSALMLLRGCPNRERKSRCLRVGRVGILLGRSSYPWFLLQNYFACGYFYDDPFKQVDTLRRAFQFCENCDKVFERHDAKCRSDRH